MYSPLYPCTLPSFYWPKSIHVTDTSLPLVTCIMPTANRDELMLGAIQQFLWQDYPYKELIIIDDGDKSAARLVPNLYSIRYFYLREASSIGVKRNKACEKAAGNIIMHLDDDDWYAADCISHQVSTLLRSGADICGLSRIQYYSMLTKSKYHAPENINRGRLWLSGATLAYYKSFWKKHKFKDLQVGEDDDFIRNNGAKLYAHNYYKGFVATIHSSNVRIKEF